MQTGTASIQMLSGNNSKKKLSGHNYTGSPVTDTLTNGFFKVDRSWKVQYWNKAAEKLLGVQAEDIIGKNIWDKFADLLPLEFYTVYQSAFLQTIPVHFEEYWGQMGAWFDVVTYHLDDTLSVSFKSSNKPHAEYPENPYQRLKVLTELYKFVTEITNDCLWEWDVQQKEIFWIDGGHKKVFGYPIENALIPQQFWEACLHPDDRQRVLDKITAAIDGGITETWQDEYRFRKANGEYAYVCDRGHLIYQDGVVARIIGATQDNTEKVLLENKLEVERAEGLMEVTNAVITAQENERSAIGRELHDNINQVLAIAKMNIQMAKTHTDKTSFYLDKSLELVSNVITDIRLLTKKMIIPALEFTGLFENIRNLIEDLSEVHPSVIAFYTSNLTEAEINEKLRVNIYRIIQEQLNNILTHTKATYADIALFKDAGNIVLLISDNGEGCEVGMVKKGVGSINIMSRAHLFHGTVYTISTPGEGYLLKITFPVSNPEQVMYD